MNRAKLAAILVSIASVTVGTVTYTIWRPKNTADIADIADAGVNAANRVATCPVKVSDECRAKFGAKQYETLRFPIYLDVVNATTSNVILPPASKAVKSCIDIIDFSKCDMDPVATFPAVAAKWGDANPFTRVAGSSKAVIPDCRNPDGGWNDQHAPVACTRTQVGGGTAWAGCNVMPRSESNGAQCLNAPSLTVMQGDRLEDSL